MNDNAILKNYMSQEIMTSHPIKNTILIYEKCIAKFRLVDRLFAQFKFKEAEEGLEKLEMVFYELKMQVNEKGAEQLAEDLHNLYDWILREIEKMKVSRKPSEMKGIEKVLMDLIEGYEGALAADGID